MEQSEPNVGPSVDATVEAIEHEIEEAHDGFSPNGTFLFVMLMLLGYGLYWAYLWFIVVIERG